MPALGGFAQLPANRQASPLCMIGHTGESLTFRARFLQKKPDMTPIDLKTGSERRF